MEARRWDASKYRGHLEAGILMKRKHKVKLEQIVHPLKDSGGRFIPYCDFGWHQGLITSNYYQTCRARRCRHYKELRIGSPYSYETERFK